MARKPRLDRSGCLHHVMARGNAGGAIFSDDEDRQAFLALVEDGVGRFGHTVHAFCLMGNHFHLAIRTGEVPLSKIMQNLMFRYTRHMNRRHGRIGHLFQGRFKSVLVDEQSYLLELVRYIHLNPVRAGLVKRPEEWPWSGHRAYLGRAGPKCIDTGWVLGVFGGKPATARRRYAAFVRQGMREGHREEFHRGGERAGVLGEESFLRRLRLVKAKPVRAAKDLGQVVAAACSGVGVSEEDLRRPGRDRDRAELRATVALLAQEAGSATLSEVALRLGRDVTTLSRSVGLLRARIRTDEAFARRVRHLRRNLSGGEGEGQYANTQA